MKGAKGWLDNFELSPCLVLTRYPFILDISGTCIHPGKSIEMKSSEMPKPKRNLDRKTTSCKQVIEHRKKVNASPKSTFSCTPTIPVVDPVRRDNSPIPGTSGINTRLLFPSNRTYEVYQDGSESSDDDLESHLPTTGIHTYNKVYYKKGVKYRKIQDSPIVGNSIVRVSSHVQQSNDPSTNVFNADSTIDELPDITPPQNVPRSIPPRDEISEPLEEIPKSFAERPCKERTLPRHSRHGKWFKETFSYDPTRDYKSEITLKGMNKICPYCRALKFHTEAPGMCCQNGKVQLPLLREPPDMLKLLYDGRNEEGKQFLKEIRSYNCAFSMTSFGAKIERYDFMQCFKIQGVVYHLLGPLECSSDTSRNGLQIFFLDSREQTNCRMSMYQRTRRTTIEKLQHIIEASNSYVASFKYALELIDCPEYDIVIHSDRKPDDEHRGRFNAPTCSEIAVLLSGTVSDNRDIRLKKRHVDGEYDFQRIHQVHRAYVPLQYPLLHIFGEDGYHDNLGVTGLQFYAYMFMIRSEYFCHLQKSERLFQQYAVDAYAMIESRRLHFYKINQKILRRDSFIHLQDAINADADPERLGKLCILPASFTGGPRYMIKKMHDALTFVQKFGKPDFFITFTCNPQWPEIYSELFDGQHYSVRDDIVVRVFKAKLDQFIEVLKKKAIFGDIRCYIYTVEWQKRGNPHVHILLWMEEAVRTDDLDLYISAEIPNPARDKDLYNKVKKHMIHGPCGPMNPQCGCMIDNRCSKNYPKDFNAATTSNVEGYPLYRRRPPGNGGYDARVGYHEVNNQWVVPYNPLLLKIFDAHVNVEYCRSVRSIKYICKYINKGSDAAIFSLQNRRDLDEIKVFQDARYISSSEAFWRIFTFDVHKRYPSVMNLHVHLENAHTITFTRETFHDVMFNRRKTTLEAFFDLCKTDDFAKTLLYADVPSYYTFKVDWKRRKRGTLLLHGYGASGPIYRDSTIGRLYNVYPSHQECFHLRLLLLHVQGPTCFADLRRHPDNPGIVAPTYREACLVRGLIDNDHHWDETLREAAVCRLPSTMRGLFAVLLHICNMSDPPALWLKYRDHMIEDFEYNLTRQKISVTPYIKEGLYNRALAIIEDKVLDIGGQRLPYYSLPDPIRNDPQHEHIEILREISYNQDMLKEILKKDLKRLNYDQKEAFVAVTQSITTGQGKFFFLDAPGGTGKTFLINVILAFVRSHHKIAVAVASSGIAATLLPGGRTAHSAFRIPIDIQTIDFPTCNITSTSGRGELLKRTHLIIWDECTMAHKKCIEALNHTLQDLRGNSLLMGGITVLLSGDFRQTLPIVKKGTRADEVEASLVRSNLWPKLTRLKLHMNMRVQRARIDGNRSIERFEHAIISIGNGSFPKDANDSIDLTSVGKVVQSTRQLMEEVFPNLNENLSNLTWLRERTILAPKNETVSEMNNILLDQLNGRNYVKLSIDSLVENDDGVNYSVEFLNSLEPSGLPPHKLNLKKGAPIMLLRNMDPPTLCNGTRLVVNDVKHNVIVATIITGCGAGKRVFIPKIPILPSDVEIPFKRIQFPVRLSFAMTINKSQGQSLRVAGIQLEESCFSHGQLYVALSRVGCSDNLKIFAPGGHTKNVVYHEVLASVLN